MSSSRTQPAGTAGRVVAWTLGAVLLVAVAAAAWVGVRGMLAFGHLQDAQRSASSLAAGLDDPAAAAPAIAGVSDDAAAAHALTSDPIWRLAEGLPWVGPQLAAVSSVAAAADELATQALQPLAEAASTFSLDSLAPQDGAVDVTAIAGLRTAAQAAASGVSRAHETVGAVDRSRLLGGVRRPVDEVQGLIQQVGTGADALARATVLMPPMLGADGPRSYLVIFQNNAEWRSLGGIVGAMAVVSTDAGRISLSSQGSSSDFTRYDQPVIPLGDEILGIYDTRPARYIQNATQVADFSVAAQIARDMWARESGTPVDGVISLDPVALSYLLEATGPVVLPSGDRLSSENAVPLLLNEVYLRYEDPRVQDAFFAAAAAAVFEALSTGGTDPTELITGLVRAGEEHRLLLWSAHPDEQAVLDGTTLQGGLPVTDAQRTSFGVYLNDGTGAKMDYYMSADAVAGTCNDTEGDPDVAMTLRLANHAPADAPSLPDYITGAAAYGVAEGETLTVVYAYLPTGSELLWSVGTGDGSGSVVDVGEHDGRRVLSWSATLAPDEEATLALRVRAPITPLLDIRVTPIVNTIETPALAPACDLPE